MRFVIIAQAFPAQSKSTVLKCWRMPTIFVWTIFLFHWWKFASLVLEVHEGVQNAALDVDAEAVIWKRTGTGSGCEKEAGYDFESFLWMQKIPCW